MTVHRARTDDEVAAALAVREAVFVDEQGIDPAVDRDGADETATQFLAVVDESAPLPTDADGRPVVGTARLRRPAPEVARGERVAVRRPYRGEGHATALVEALAATARERGADRLVGHAQASALSLFRTFGFTVDGESFTEAGIEHSPVVYDL